jgi:diguanylate cyclase (GGDEF)-like protein
MYRAEYLNTYPFFEKVLKITPVKAIHDSLTGVIARPFILSFIHDLISRGVPFTLAIMDLDNFKRVNDDYGHKAGDMVLSDAAASLREYYGEDGVIGRFGGDEFLAVYLKSVDYDTLHTFYKRLFMPGGAFRRTIHLQDASIFLTATVGSASFPKDAEQFDDLFQQIDKVLYRGKAKGRNCFIIYVPSKHDRLQIPELAGHSLYETLYSMAEAFDSGGDTEEKLLNAFRTLREMLRFQKLLHISRDGRLMDTENHRLLAENVGFHGGTTTSLQPVEEVEMLKDREPQLYKALDALGLESVLFARLEAGQEEYACLIICPEAHAKHIWQDKELSAAFVLARMLSQQSRSE